jgi:4'-phosphopantetheinyl transferase EntD
VPDVDVASIEVGDHLAEIFAAERAIVRDAAVKRQWQFASGRLAAHRIWQRMGLTPQAILRDGRAPRWPDPWIGSISHTDTLAVAALARRERIRGLGVDVERRGRLTTRLLRMILTPREIAHCGHGADLESALVIFSAKEAIYKAVQGEVGGYIGFQDVEVELEAPEFRARCVSERVPADPIESGRGTFEICADVVATLFRVPARAPSRG